MFDFLVLHTVECECDTELPLNRPFYFLLLSKWSGGHLISRDISPRRKLDKQPHYQHSKAFLFFFFFFDSSTENLQVRQIRLNGSLPWLKKNRWEKAISSENCPELQAQGEKPSVWKLNSYLSFLCFLWETPLR